MTNPYSYALTGGVQNTRVIVAGEADLADLASEHSEPIVLPLKAAAYHALSKRERSATKKALPYFVGGVVSGRRDDVNVVSRTLLTLDVEQGPNDATPPPPPQDVVQALTRLGGAGWVYTSTSHTTDSPRYRVVLPLGTPITGEHMADTLRDSTLSAAGKLGVQQWTKPESWVLSQPMYLPARLTGAVFYQRSTTGRKWATARPRLAVPVDPDRPRPSGAPADIPDQKPDEVLSAIKSAGLYLRENPKHKGMHFIVCPYMDQHGAENDSQTVYYEAHYDGNPRPAVKCFDTDADTDGKPHLTVGSLVRYLRDNDHLTQAQQDAAGILDDDEAFLRKADLGLFLAEEPVPREWAIDQFAPVGKVTVLAGPGGVSKSMLALHVLMYAALGRSFGPFTPMKPVKSLYVSYEDDRQEMHKRVYTLTEGLRRLDDGVFDALYDVQGSLRKNMLMYAADDDAANWLLLTKPDRFGPPERAERVDWLIGLIQRNGIKLLVLDPAVYTHQLEENNIADMAVYMQTLTAIAKQARCAVVVLHHMSKAGSWLSLDDINQGSLRGASSFADNARSVGVVVSLPVKDAVTYGQPAEPSTSSKFMVFKHVKHNYSAPMGTYVFERKGALLIPRADVVRMDAVVLKEQREQAITQREAQSTQIAMVNMLRVMADHDGFISMTQAGLGAHIHRRRIREVVDLAVEQDLIEMEPGPRNSVMVRTTKAGLKWLKQQEQF